MDDDLVFARNLELQGLALPADRRTSVATALARQIAAERTATATIPFEAEPAGFTRALEDGAR